MRKDIMIMSIKIISQEEAEQLLHMEKKIVGNDTLQDTYYLRTPTDFFARFPMRSLDGNNLFLMQISQSPYKQIKIDFHFQENCQYIGLLRVDYHSIHKNPETMNEHVPPIAQKYCGHLIDDSHIHFYVEGYRRLDWAIPLTVSRFPIKDIRMEDPDSLLSALRAFSAHIGLTTKIQTEGRLFL
ncbi:MAG: hypothetical protein UDO91_06680 [Megasphaera elsdenii]|nr:hypothetical protein [Megasphaera elsdenii]